MSILVWQLRQRRPVPNLPPFREPEFATSRDAPPVRHFDPMTCEANLTNCTTMVVAATVPVYVIFGHLFSLFMTSPNGQERLSTADLALEAVRFLEVEVPSQSVLAASPSSNRIVAEPAPYLRTDDVVASPVSPPLLVDLTNINTTRRASSGSLRELVAHFCSSLQRSPPRSVVLIKPHVRRAKAPPIGFIARRSSCIVALSRGRGSNPTTAA